MNSWWVRLRKVLRAAETKRRRKPRYAKNLSLELLEDRLAPAHFAVIGSYGLAGQPELNVAKLVSSWNPDFVLTVGNNNYPSGAASTIDANIGQYYHTYISPYTGSYGSGAASNMFWPTLGSHDWDAAGATPYLNYFTLPNNERYYDFTVGNIELFALDSSGAEPDGNTSGSTQGQWLQAQLAASTATWKLVYFQSPPYSSTGNQTSGMRWPFQAWGATAVLAGLSKTYERRTEDNNLPYFI